jgi:iron complex outermembrane receptor protein
MSRTVLLLSAVLLTAAGPLYAQQTGAVEGRVTSAETGAPLPDANVVLDGPQRGAATDSTGRFVIEDVETARYELVVSRVGYAQYRQSVRVEPGQTAEVDVALRPTSAPLAPVVVTGRRALTQPPTEAAAARLRLVAGGTNLVRLDEGTRRPIATLADALDAEPGVVIQEFFGGNDQPRINIRGSGIQSNPLSRGVLLQQNGFPLNFADGSFVTGLVEPRLAKHISVYRGSNALRQGGSALGGALDLVSQTGRSSPNLRAKVLGGSYGTVAGDLQYGGAGEQTDVFAIATGHRQNGFRAQNNEGTRFLAHTNAGYRWGPNLETRVYGTLATLDFEIPGPLNGRSLEADPTSVSQGPTPTSLGPNVPRDRPRRSTELYRAATRTTWVPRGTGNTRLEGGLAYQHTEDDFFFPLTAGVRSTQADDLMGDLQFERTGALLGTRGITTLGAAASFGVMDRTYAANERGTRGRPFGDNDLQAANVRLFAKQTLRAGPGLTLTGAVQGIAAPREIEEAFPTPGTRPRYVAPKDTYKPFSSGPANFEETYWGINPMLGVRYEVQPALSVFGNVARSFEPPTFNTLLSPSKGKPNKGPGAFGVFPLDAQRGTTVEVGTRRTDGRLQWDVTAYRTWIEGELLSTTRLFGGPGATRNSPVRTIHQGLETQVRAQLARRVFASNAGGDPLLLEATYNLSDFYFDTDERNQIAGVPRHRLHARLTYRPGGLTLEPTLTWMPQRTPTDHANTIYQEPYALFGARVSYAAPGGWLGPEGRLTVFAEAENLTDATYASSYLVRDRVPTPPPPPLSQKDVVAFIPGPGRSLRVGVTVGW